MPTPTVSVLVVNYRSYAELDRCLTSIRQAASADRTEIVVVDNATERRLLDPLVRSHQTVTFLPRQDNPGFATGVNHAASHAHGDYLLLLNPDAELREGALTSMVRFLEAHPDVAIVGPRVLDPDGSIQQSARSFPNMWTGLFGRTSFLTRLWPGNPMTRRNLRAAESDSASYLVDWVAGSCLMVRADVFRKAGGLDSRFFMYWEDADFCRRVRALGWKTAYLPSAAVMHQCGRSSRHASTRSLVAFHRSALRYYVKHHRGPARYVGAPLAAAALALRLSLKIMGTSAHQLRTMGRPSRS